MDICREVRQRGGIASTRELLRAGATSHGLTVAVRTGVLIRIRKGHYGLPGADIRLETAFRVGGQATCLTRGEQLGLWIIPDGRLHVRVDRHAARLRQPDDATSRLPPGAAGVRVHWCPLNGGRRDAVSAVDALLDLIDCQSYERVVAAADSAIRAGLLSKERWIAAISRLPHRDRRMLSRVDPESESILESIVRFQLSLVGIDARVQIRIDGVGRVDLLIGDRLVIELDGWQFHQTRDEFEEDRRRDAELARRGYRVLRFSYRAVMESWPSALATIQACMRRREHIA